MHVSIGATRTRGHTARFQFGRTSRPSFLHTYSTTAAAGGRAGANPLDLLAELGDLGDMDMRKMVDEAFNVSKCVEGLGWFGCGWLSA